MALTEEQIANLVQILTITTPIAMFFSGFIVLSFLKFDSLRTRSFVLVFILSVSDFCYSTSTIINQNPVTGTILCDFQATMVTFLAMNTMLWTLMISVVLERVVVRQLDPIPLWMSSFIDLSISTTVAFLPYISNVYGLSGAQYILCHPSPPLSFQNFNTVECILINVGSSFISFNTLLN